MTAFFRCCWDCAFRQCCRVPWRTQHLLDPDEDKYKVRDVRQLSLHCGSCRATRTGLHVPAPTQSHSSFVLGLHFLSPRTPRSLLCHLPRTISLLPLAPPNQHHNKRPQSSTTAHYQHYCLIRTDILDVRQFERIFYEQLFCLQSGRQRRRQRPSTR